MRKTNERYYDLAIVGGGPVGSVCAIAHAKKGARVALLEANPKASNRLAGEWLHPPAVKILRDLGIEFNFDEECVIGKGFVVAPEDKSKPMMLPYPNESRGLAIEHSKLISRLHEAVRNEPNIDFITPARVRAIEDEQIIYSVDRFENSITADRIVGADGRASFVRKTLGLSTKLETCSRMVGTVVKGIDLPLKGYGHVLLGGPGPILMYQIADQRIRVITDIPLDHWTPRNRVELIAESYTKFMPEEIRNKFIESLQSGDFQAAANELKPRNNYGNPKRVLIGDAAGHYHPMTSVGMTLGFGDAIALAESKNFDEFKNNRFLSTRAPEFLAMGIYEVFADYRFESVALRQAIYRTWRSNKKLRDQTINLIACEDTSTVNFGVASSFVILKTFGEFSQQMLNRFTRQRAYETMAALKKRLTWLVRGAQEQNRLRRTNGVKDARSRELLANAFCISMPSEANYYSRKISKEIDSIDVSSALMSSIKHLLNIQAEDGSWEGEMVWSPIITAQYVLLHHIIGQPLEADRRRLILRHFEVTQLNGEFWGLHEHSSPNLFVTTLVYVAIRILEVTPDDPLIAPARRFIQAADVLEIPSWGKFWLALLNLYDWQGVNAIIPEMWSLPSWVAFHPSNWYCHTRLIYMAMASIYSTKYRVPTTPIIAALREELYPQGYNSVKFSKSRNRLRNEDIFVRPSSWLRAGYMLTNLLDSFHSKRLRNRCIKELIRHIKWELQTTNHRSISPVSGILNIIATWIFNGDDSDFRLALAGLDNWIWEDEENGMRVTGARSISWDGGFCLQALATVTEYDGVKRALSRGAEFLRQQQISHSFSGFQEEHRIDPKGGWCFSDRLHGWPVTDCTAEAVLGITSADCETAGPTLINNAIQFMLRGQNRDGGFGTYEARRSRVGLEWLNPAEVFGESMSENSYVECTGSCLCALATCKSQFPQLIDDSVVNSMSKADAFLRRTQRSDGSWRGVWGIQYIYGTFFGIRGLLAAGATPGDPALRLACQWLLARQRRDGGWGEHHSGSPGGKYVEHEESQVIHTAWALIALLESGDSNWPAIMRGIEFLLKTQNSDGTWPKQDMAGVFFRTALLDYVLYRQYFPLHALGLFEKRQTSRQNLANSTMNIANAA